MQQPCLTSNGGFYGLEIQSRYAYCVGIFPIVPETQISQRKLAGLYFPSIRRPRPHFAIFSHPAFRVTSPALGLDPSRRRPAGPQPQPCSLLAPPPIAFQLR
ncbi:hypothetical protein ABW21_db0207454 [Orbilia brochopaga]|nr:hypothetical protein ABW21_db0207454 [Drechslerella brochopaga]